MKPETLEARFHREQIEAACDDYKFDRKRGTHKLRKFDYCEHCRIPKWAHDQKLTQKGKG